MSPAPPSRRLSPVAPFPLPQPPLLPWLTPTRTAACLLLLRHTSITLGRPLAGVLMSSDQGRKWEPSQVVSRNDTWLIEGTLFERRDGSVVHLFRTVLGLMFASESSDGGKSWSAPYEFVLPNPNAKFHALRLRSGLLVVCYNHQSFDRRRIRLHLAASNDEGKSWWFAGRLIPAAINEEAPNQRWHYPTIAEDPDRPGVVHIAYSCDFSVPGEADEAELVDAEGAGDEGRMTGGIRIATADLRTFRPSEATRITEYDIR